MKLKLAIAVVMGLLLLSLLDATLACSKKQSDAGRAGSADAVVSPTTQDPDYRRELIDSKESAYNNIYIYKSGPYRTLTFGHNEKLFNESTCNTQDDRDLAYPYTRFMTAALLYPETVHSILEIGSGVGATSGYIHRFRPDMRVTTVELDSVVVEMAKKHCGLKDEKNFQVTSRDGRMFLASSN